MESLRRWRTLSLIAVGYAAGGVGYVWLPEGPAYLSEPAFWSKPSIRMLVTFLLPTTAAAIYASLRIVWRRDPVRDPEEAFESACEPILFAVGAFILAMHVMVLGVVTGAIPQSVTVLSLYDARALRLAARERRQPAAAHTPQPCHRLPHEMDARKSPSVDARAQVVWIPRRESGFADCRVRSAPAESGDADRHRVGRARDTRGVRRRDLQAESRFAGTLTRRP